MRGLPDTDALIPAQDSQKKDMKEQATTVNMATH